MSNIDLCIGGYYYYVVANKKIYSDRLETILFSSIKVNKTKVIKLVL
jgi:hypothetical protein